MSDRLSESNGENLHNYAGITAADRTLRVLEAMVGSHEGVTVSELSATLGIEKSITSRILSTLQAAGYVRYSPSSRRYVLSLKFVALAYRHVDSIGFPDVCMPILRQLSDRIGELVMLAVVGEEGVVLFAKAEPKHELQVVSRLGRPVPLHASSAAKIWLASLPVDEALRKVAAAGMPQVAPNTITSLKAFAVELDRVRQRGYATSLQERFAGVNAMAVPIRSRKSGEVVGAIVLSAPTNRIPETSVESYIPLLREAAQELSLIWPLPDLPREPGDGAAALSPSSVQSEE